MQLLPVPGTSARVACLDIGARTGPATVWIGGLGSATTVVFAPVVGHPALAGHRHVLIDLVGSGWSDHDDTFSHSIEGHAAVVASVLDTLGLRDVTLVGHSLGGSTAISLATQRRDLIGELIVAEPNLDPGVGTWSAHIASFDEDDFVAHGYGQMIEALGQAADAGDEWAGVDVRTMRHWSPFSLHRTSVSLLAERRPTFREQLTALDIPKSYISGVLTGEDLDALRATGCDVRTVADAGHVMMHDNLDGFIACLSTSRSGDRKS